MPYRSRHEFAGTERFEILSRIGSGGMGVVYRARDRERDAVVALKTLRQMNAKALYRFKREFRSLQNLEHPNLIRLGELIEEEGHWFYTMELIKGVDFITYSRPEWARTPETTNTRGAPATLADAPDGGRDALDAVSLEPPPPAAGAVAFDESKLRYTLRQLAEAIAALHQANRIHRDIKPSNVLVTDEGRVVLVDFGLVAETDSAERSSTGHLIGTAFYMAPEQAGDSRVEPAADWYSFGVLLYEALTGQLPIAGSNALQVFIEKQTHKPLPPSERVPDIPADLDALCVGLLEIDPKNRPTASAILDALSPPTVSDPSSVDADSSARFAQAAPVDATPSVPFVGRANELETLNRAFEDVLAHLEPITLFIHGESGLGKTELVRQFTQRLAASRDDVVVLTGRCYERETVPYKAFDGIADALSNYLYRLPELETASVMPRRAKLLSNLFPVLDRVDAIAESPRDVDAAIDPHEQRRRMFASLRELFEKIAERHAMVLVIDDFQWTDADSLPLLRELLYPPEAPALLLLATARTTTTGEEDAKVRTAADSLPGKVQHMRLRALSPERARELVQLLAPSLAPYSEAIVEEAAGHPLFLQEMVRYSSEAGAEREAMRLDDVLWARVAKLPDAARELAEVVAVAGGPITHAVATQASGQERDEYDRSLAFLRSTSLVRSTGARESDLVEPYHDRVREAVVANLDEARCASLHGKLAAAIEASGSALSDPHAVVRHLEAAGEAARAARRAEDAARRANRLSAFDQAAELYRVTLRLGEHDDESRRKLQLELAAALASSCRGPEAAEAYLAAAEEAEPALRLECHRQAAEQWLITGHVDEGLGVLGALLDEIGARMAATPRRALLSVVWHRFRLKLRGLRWTERAEDEVPPELLSRVDVLKPVGQSLALIDNVRGADFNSRFLLEALRAGEVHRVGVAMSVEACYLSTQGGRATRRARGLVRQVEKLVEQRPDDKYLLAWATVADGIVGYFEGRFLAAEARLEQADHRFRAWTAGTTYERNNARLFRTFCLCHMGDLAKARLYADEYIRDAQRRGDRYLETSVRRYAGRVAFLLDDDPDEALRDLERVDWSPREGGYHLQHFWELEARGEIALYASSSRATLSSLEDNFADLARSLLLRVQSVRVRSRWLRARLLLSAADETEPTGAEQAETAKLAKQLGKEGIGFATVPSLLVGAAVSLRTAASDEHAVGRLRGAIEAAEKNDMYLHAAAARLRLGKILGGAEGEMLIAAGLEWFSEQRAANPWRMAETVAPGFGRPE